MDPTLILIALGAYLLGALPMGFLLGRARGIDLREHGSGNIGATNAFRVLGKPLGILVFLLDFAKGLAPTLLAPRLSEGSDPASSAALVAGLAAVIGHVFPVYLGFRGGKGVATAAGAFTGLQPVAALCALAIWVLVLLAFRLVSLASLLAAWAFPLTFILLAPHAALSERRPVLIAAVIVGVLITIRHRSNIGRLLRGEEPRIGAGPRS